MAFIETIFSCVLASRQRSCTSRNVRVMVIVAAKLISSRHEHINRNNSLVRVHLIDPFENVNIGRSVELFVVSNDISGCEGENQAE